MSPTTPPRSTLSPTTSVPTPAYVRYTLLSTKAFLNLAIQTITSETEPIDDSITAEEEYAHVAGSAKRKGKHARAVAKDEFEYAEEEGAHLWAIAKERLFRPGVAGGLFGLGERIVFSFYLLRFSVCYRSMRLSAHAPFFFSPLPFFSQFISPTDLSDPLAPFLSKL